MPDPSLAALAPLLVTVRADRAAPLQVALAGRLRALVADGRLPLGVRLPAERELAVALGVSRSTVSAAYARLRADGWARARQGAGTWTALPPGPHRGAWVPSPSRPGVIDLAHAAPSASPAVAAAYATALAELPRLLPEHGYDPLGLRGLRERIAQRYSARGVPTGAEQVLVTSGALHGVWLALSALLRRGERVVVDDPTYPNTVDAARSLGLRLVPVALRAEDPDGWLDRLLRTVAEVRPAAAYVMPDFHNPTGQLLDDERRRRLARGLAAAGTRPIVDETFVELGLDAAPGAPLAAAAPDAVSVGTLSKAFWGGLRVGWVRAEPEVVRRLTSVLVRSYLSGPAVEQLAACALLDGAAESLPAQQAALRQRRDLLREELRGVLPGWEVPCPAGGLVLWCRLPTRRSTALVEAAAARGLQLVPGPRFGSGHALEDRLRLPYTQPPDVLRRAVGLLAAADAQVAGGAGGRGVGGSGLGAAVV